MLKSRLLQFALVAAVVVMLIGVAYAAAPKTYQVTGPVLSITDDTIVVQKGNDKWELGRTADTKVTGDLKVGAKVTVKYESRAAEIEVKAK